MKTEGQPPIEQQILSENQTGLIRLIGEQVAKGEVSGAIADTVIRAIESAPPNALVKEVTAQKAGVRRAFLKGKIDRYEYGVETDFYNDLGDVGGIARFDNIADFTQALELLETILFLPAGAAREISEHEKSHADAISQYSQSTPINYSVQFSIQPNGQMSLQPKVSFANNNLFPETISEGEARERLRNITSAPKILSEGDKRTLNDE